MSAQFGSLIAGAVVLMVVLALILLRKRLGELNAASWLVVWGAVIMMGEHPQFAITYTVPLIEEAEAMTLLPHARIHFFMAGIYAIIGVGLLCVVARTLLLSGQPVGWYAVLFTLIVGAGFDLVMGGLWYEHGSPIYSLFRGDLRGFGWEFLYGYIVAWAAALIIAYKPIFQLSD